MPTRTVPSISRHEPPIHLACLEGSPVSQTVTKSMPFSTVSSGKIPAVYRHAASIYRYKRRCPCILFRGLRRPAWARERSRPRGYDSHGRHRRQLGRRSLTGMPSYPTCSISIYPAYWTPNEVIIMVSSPPLSASEIALTDAGSSRHRPGRSARSHSRPPCLPARRRSAPHLRAGQHV
jgi:hypothetical protein